MPCLKGVMSAVVLNLGSGDSKHDHEIGVDIRVAKGTDIVADLEAPFLPFRDSTVDGVRALHVLEHLSDLIHIMDEIHRVCKDGGEVKIEVPYFSHSLNFRDPTHKRLFSWGMFDNFVDDDKRQYCRTTAKFDYVEKTLHFTPGLMGLVGRFLFWLSPRRYDKYHAYVCPAFGYRVTLRTIK